MGPSWSLCTHEGSIVAVQHGTGDPDPQLWSRAREGHLPVKRWGRPRGQEVSPRLLSWPLTPPLTSVGLGAERGSHFETISVIPSWCA